MKLAYVTESYLSLQRVATDYLRVLSGFCDIVRDPRLADVVIVHTHVSTLAETLEKLPKKPVIAYLVWETDCLPAAWPGLLAPLHAIWTPSQYSARAFAPHHPRVVLIPHIVQALPQSTAQDRAYVRGLVHKGEGELLVLGIATADLQRKNLAQLARAFARVQAAVPGARLVLKTLRGGAEEARSHTTLIDVSLSAGQMRALYELCDVYVSPHRGEGWGLSISDAMFTGTLTVASAHSGNMDYMDATNSFPIPCTRERGSSEMSGAYFPQQAEWALIDDSALAASVVHACEVARENGVRAQRIRAAARASLARFSAEHIGQALEDALSEFLRTPGSPGSACCNRR